MARFILLFLTIVSLSSCASILDKATQDITFETPGAHDSVCFVKNGNIHYRTWPPETITISKRKGPLEVHCLADGNRERTVQIDPFYKKETALNVFNGFAPGAFVDHHTGAMFDYPDQVIIDFTEIPVSPMPSPSYHQQLKENPDLFGMEEFRSGKSALMKDRNRADYELKKKEMFSETKSESQDLSKNWNPADDVVSDITKKMNPQIFGTQSAPSTPTEHSQQKSSESFPVPLLPLDEQK